MSSLIRPEIKNLTPYVPGKPIDEVKRELNLKTVIKLASNESPYPPFPQAIEAVKNAIIGVNRYPDTDAFYLKRALAEFYNVSEKNIALGNGSNELLRLVAQSLLEPGDETIAGIPSFVVYPTITKMMGGKIKEVNLKDYRLDLETMKKEINPKTKIIFLCNPNNPTGTIVYREEVNDFLQDLPEEVLIVFDEAYFEYVEDANFPNGMDYFREGRNVAVFRTFSKIYSLAGCRIGYAIMSEELVEAVNKAREPFNVNSLAQVAALASLKAQDEVKRRSSLNLQNKKYLYEKLDDLGIKYIPSQANFILIDLKKDCNQVFNALLKEGVIVRTGEIFGSGYETFIRVTIGTREENKKFIEALEKVLKEVE